MIYYIDFDGTICPNHGGDPQKECVQTINDLKRLGHRICIYSCRSNPICVPEFELSTQEMVNYLHHYNIPYDEIIYGKPYYNYIIDDRSVGIPLTRKHDVDWAALRNKMDI